MPFINSIISNSKKSRAGSFLGSSAGMGESGFADSGTGGCENKKLHSIATVHS